MNKAIIVAMVCLVPLLMVAQSETNRFSQVRIEAPFDQYLESNPFLMEYAGAKIIKLGDGQKMIISVASTMVKDDSTQDRLRQQKVCKVKALANILSETKSIQVSTSAKVNDRTVVTVVNGNESGKSIEELLDVSESKVSGVVKSLPIVGTWYSRSGDMFYLAIGGIVGTNETAGGNLTSP